MFFVLHTEDGDDIVLLHWLQIHVIILMMFNFVNMILTHDCGPVMSGSCFRGLEGQICMITRCYYRGFT